MDRDDRITCAMMALEIAQSALDVMLALEAERNNMFIMMQTTEAPN